MTGRLPRGARRHWADLALRPAAEVNGGKGKWAAIIAVNFVGPVLYFRRGIRR